MSAHIFFVDPSPYHFLTPADVEQAAFIGAAVGTAVLLLAIFTAPTWGAIMWQKLRNRWLDWRMFRAVRAAGGVKAMDDQLQKRWERFKGRLVFGVDPGEGRDKGTMVGGWASDGVVHITMVAKLDRHLAPLQLRTDLVAVPKTTGWLERVSGFPHPGVDALTWTLGRNFDKKTGGPLAGIQAQWDARRHDEFMWSPFRNSTLPKGKCGWPSCPVCGKGKP